MHDNLQFLKAVHHPNLVCVKVTELLNNWTGRCPAEDIQVAEIDPNFAGGQEFCSRYGVPFNKGANCVIVEAVRNNQSIIAACVSLVGHQVKLNSIVRKLLHARKVSLAPLEMVLNSSQMEYGSITPFGLPSTWRILIDSQVMNTKDVVIGSGILKSKLFLPSTVLMDLPGAEVVDGMAMPVGQGGIHNAK